MIRQDWSTLKKLMFMKTAAGGGAAIEATATGNPLTFQTDLARPLKSLLIPFSPRQEGSGDPSPQNIRSIIPWNGLKVFGGGKNLFNPSAEIVTVQNTSQSNRSAIRLGIKNCKLTFSATAKTEGDLPTYNINVAKYKNGVADGVNTFISSVSGATTRTVEFASDEEAILIYALNNDETFASNIAKFNIQVEVGTTVTAYEPYKPITETDIVFPSPVYGGTLDVVSGARSQTILFISAKWKDFEGNTAYTDTVRRDLVIPYNCLYGSAGNGKTLCNVAKYKYNNDDDPHFYLTDAKRIRCFMPKDMDGETEITFACTLAEPIPLESIEPHQLTALIGNNTIWSDADGQMTTVYLVSGKYAEDHPVGGLSSGLGSGLLGSNPDPDEPIEDPEENPEE